MEQFTGPSAEAWAVLTRVPVAVGSLSTFALSAMWANPNDVYFPESYGAVVGIQDETHAPSDQAPQPTPL